MKALVVIDAQNEFSEEGKRAVPDYPVLLENILREVTRARTRGVPVAWVRHFNRAEESSAFMPQTWGSEFSPGCGPSATDRTEPVFEKNVFGAFTGTQLAQWLEGLRIAHVQLAGFYTHMCVSTTTREALMRGYSVSIDPSTTGACGLRHPVLGEQSAQEVHRSALLQLAGMGALIERSA